jgi:transcriptional regulator with XRE-family HTH domain
MTQKDHAALAGVSIPTIVAFDRGEFTLTLSKAFDILRVVGLLVEVAPETAQGNFVREAYARWQRLVGDLPKRSPARFPDGSYRIDYWLEGDLRPIELHRFQELLERAVLRVSGWPPFWVPTHPELAPREVDGTIECWLKPEESGVVRAVGGDPAHCDFWRASPSGRIFLMRGYQEDSQETFPPATVFDTTLPIWRLGETLLHAGRLAALLGLDPNRVKVHFRAHYTGMLGRRLTEWARPIGGRWAFGGQPARSDEAVIETVIEAARIDADLDQIVHPLVSSLFERFGVAGLTREFVASELARMRKRG